MLAPREPVPISQSAHSMLIWAIAAANTALFAFYVYILHDVDLLQGILGWVMTAVGAIFFVVEFFLIRYFINRNTRVRQADQDR
jgi:4-amino-4-deoxy-L-arabinose transferase-like glycosyltransferase